MTKKILLITFHFILVFIKSSTSIDIECSYQVNSYTVVERIYDCRVNNNPNITTKDSTEITSINENHVDSRSSDDVHGIWASSKIIHYFPKGFDKIFKNIKAIYIYMCGLKEIHQLDLKVFPNLVYIYLSGNAIEIIEEGLFDFNPDLQFVGLNEKNTIHIDSNVFDYLDGLRYLRGLNVPCIRQDAVNSKDVVMDVIKIVKNQCSNLEFLLLDEKLDNLENEINSGDFEAKLDKFEKMFNNSKFLEFRPLSYKLGNLKIVESNDSESKKLEHKSSKFLIDNSDDLSTTSSISQNQFIEFVLKTQEKFEKIEQNLANKLHKMSINFDKKFNAVENRLMKKMEEILEKKLRKILNENLDNDIDMRSGKE